MTVKFEVRNLTKEEALEGLTDARKRMSNLTIKQMRSEHNWLEATREIAVTRNEIETYEHRLSEGWRS